MRRGYIAACIAVFFACSSGRPFTPLDASGGDEDVATDHSLGFPDGLADAPPDTGPLFRYVFLSSATFTGDLGGAAGADGLCQSLASDAGLPGTYKAWIATDQSAPSDRFVESEVGYELPNGLPVAQSYASLATKALLNPINVDEHARLYDGGCDIDFEPCGWTAVWTQARPNGTWEEAGASASCAGFTSADASNGHVGSYIATDSTWTSASGPTPPSCANSLPIYCFEQ